MERFTKFITENQGSSSQMIRRSKLETGNRPGKYSYKFHPKDLAELQKTTKKIIGKTSISPTDRNITNVDKKGHLAQYKHDGNLYDIVLGQHGPKDPKWYMTGDYETA